MRTYTIVGTSAALFMLVSMDRFGAVLVRGTIVVDPSRVAAQIVSGIGFVGAGLIFVDGDRVRRITTAATIWLVSAIGAACGAGLFFLGLFVTLAYFVVALIFPVVFRFIPTRAHSMHEGKQCWAMNV